jgi:hypothetical protein
VGSGCLEQGALIPVEHALSGRRENSNSDVTGPFGHANELGQEIVVVPVVLVFADAIRFLLEFENIERHGCAFQ